MAFNFGRPNLGFLNPLSGWTGSAVLFKVLKETNLLMPSLNHGHCRHFAAVGALKENQALMLDCKDIQELKQEAKYTFPTPTLHSCPFK